MFENTVSIRPNRWPVRAGALLGGMALLAAPPAMAQSADSAGPPVGKSTMIPVTAPAAAPAETPTETPAALPVQAPAATPAEMQAAAPKRAPASSVLFVPPADSVDIEASNMGAIYGPPEPKVQRKTGLPGIAWPEAPREVPPALEQAVRIVTRSYPSVMSARASLRAAAADVRAAKWMRFPSATASVAYLDSSTSPDPQLVVELPVWTGGRIESQIRRAKAGEDATSARYVSIVEELAMSTADTYFQIASLTQREQLLAESIKEHQRLVDTMQRRVNQEVSPVADLELARSRSAQIEQEYVLTRQQRLTALRVMAELVADPTYDLGPIPFFDSTIDLPDRETMEEQAVAFSPEIRRLRAEADVARAEHESTKASILPQLNAQYSYDDVRGSRVGMALRAQTTGGFSQFSEAEGARLRIDAALEQARAYEQQLRREVASDVIAYDAARSRATISRTASDTAARVSASYMRQFIAGRRSWLDVMNALREAITAQIGKADSEVTAMSTAVRLLLKSGRWRPAFTAASPERTPDRAR